MHLPHISSLPWTTSTEVEMSDGKGGYSQDSNSRDCVTQGSNGHDWLASHEPLLQVTLGATSPLGYFEDLSFHVSYKTCPRNI